MTSVECDIAKLLGGGSIFTKAAMAVALGISREAIDRGVLGLKRCVLVYASKLYRGGWRLTNDGEIVACQLLRAELIALRVEGMRLARGAA